MSSLRQTKIDEIFTRTASGRLNKSDECGFEACATVSKDTSLMASDDEESLLFVESDLQPIPVAKRIRISSDSDSPKKVAPQSVSWPTCRLDELPTTPSCSAHLPPMRPSSSLSVLFKISNDLRLRTEPPLSFPKQYEDAWDGAHVRLPCSTSPQNMYPVQKDNSEELLNRWQLIKSALSDAPINSSVDLEEAILAYNRRYASRWSFRGLHKLFADVFDAEDSRRFFSQTLPRMIELALELPHICTKPIPLLRRQQAHTIILSQKQIACLLCHAFFCTYPRRNAVSGVPSVAARQQKEYSDFPCINFNRLFGSTLKCVLEKLKLVIHYFERVTANMPTGTVSFERRLIPADQIDCLNWRNCGAQFTRLCVCADGTIERSGTGMLQLDFANKFIGGGVLNTGCVQEEIRFMICPELLISLLFTEVMDRNECVVMTGCEMYSTYSGYAETLKFTGDFVDDRSRDAWGRRETEVLAIDALMFHPGSGGQFQPRFIDRELGKAFCGFSRPEVESRHLSAIATGNWGCGAFGGDKELKSIIQLIAAAEARRDVAYFTFGDHELKTGLSGLHNRFVEMQITTGQVYRLLVAYYELVIRNNSNSRQQKQSLFEFIEAELDGTCADSDNSCSATARTGVLASVVDNPDDLDIQENSDSDC